nr:MAG TPA: distal tail protein [Caudoviricetes sp.]
MRNYVIQNGLDSRYINGLLIQELPPITKPLMRTSIEQIDGRDGDVITRLGYSAYNKKMKIGLFGDYDIDEIIPFFNTSGTVTFSNEPERYYRYDILDAVDYERLMRFRTAEITYHVQPFKYSTIEKMKVFSNPTSAITVRNNGNYVSKPIIHVKGSGTINLSLNGVQLFRIDLSTTNSIAIDTERLEAYNEDGSIFKLMNRYVVGNYDKFALKVGANSVSWDGQLTYIAFEKQSRWI